MDAIAKNIRCLLLLLVSMLDFSVGFSTGPPFSVCLSMVPLHGVPAQSSSAPYSITFNSKSHSPNDIIEVTLSSSGTPFRGVFIQARMEGSTTPIGEFTVPSNDDHLRTLNCNGNTKSAVSHRLNKLSSFKTIYWRAPPSSTGTVTFVGTFVQAKNTFWVNVQSQELTLSSSTGAKTTPLHLIQTFLNILIVTISRNVCSFP